MLKIKDIELISRDTLTVGLSAYLQIFIINFLVAITVVGILLTINVAGWVALRILGSPAKLLSRESLSVGWSVTWRYYILALPLFALVLAILYLIGPSNSPGLWLICLVTLTLLCGSVVTGWSIKRVKQHLIIVG